MIRGINHITLAVRDIERSFNFYHQLLGLTPLCRWHAGAYFLVGNIWLCLSVDLNWPQGGHADYSHLAFDVAAEDFTNWCQRLAEAGYHEFKVNRSEGDSLYIQDTDGHKLELHVGNWQSRLASKLADAGVWQNIEFFGTTNR